MISWLVSITEPMLCEQSRTTVVTYTSEPQSHIAVRYYRGFSQYRTVVIYCAFYINTYLRITSLQTLA